MEEIGFDPHEEADRASTFDHVFKGWRLTLTTQTRSKEWEDFCDAMRKANDYEEMRQRRLELHQHEAVGESIVYNVNLTPQAIEVSEAARPRSAPLASASSPRR